MSKTDSQGQEAHVDLPTESNCPECGGSPDDESLRLSKLSDMGYVHQDVHYTCEECSCQWACGVPIDGPEEEPDIPGKKGSLWCESCDETWMLPHRTKYLDSETVRLDMKCPRPECNFFRRVIRKTGPQGYALIGYPQIVGKIDGAQPFGYPAEE